MIFVDSNIPMYLVGAAHANKERARRWLDDCVEADERLVTDCEVFQEILHRYVAIGRREAIGPAFEALLSVVDEVCSIELSDVARARDLTLSVPSISARDAIHVATMERRGIRRILTFDAGFDEVPGIDRLR